MFGIRIYACTISLVCIFILSGCRGGDGTEGVPEELLDFVATPDPKQFLQFLNQPSDQFQVSNRAGLDELNQNFEEFPTAYYNTIDPDDTRTTLEDWQLANGFLTMIGNQAFVPECDTIKNCCVPQMEVTNQCEVISTHVTFRDTKDLGYGRDMYMRQYTDQSDRSGDVAIYVRNFKVDEIEGLPYGPLNLEALILEDNHWQFGVNAIEFSTYPYGANEPSTDTISACVSDPQSQQCAGLRNRKFAKFYNYSGDGRLDAGARQVAVDLDDRGVQRPMPVPCITCHGGRGTTVVTGEGEQSLALLPTLHNQLPGDLQANLVPIEVDTLQFSTATGFRKEDNEAGLLAINRAILSTYNEHQRFLNSYLGSNSGYWDPSFAIELAAGRLLDSNTGENSFDANFVPTGWEGEVPELFTDFVAPHCITCHALQGSGVNPSLTFQSSNTFQNFSSAIDHLVFQSGRMPLSLWNYREFWDFKDPATLAAALQLDDRLQNDTVIRPGAPIARISAPSVEAKTAVDIVLHGGGSSFAERFEWSISPSNASISADGPIATITLPSPDIVSDAYTVTLRVSNASNSCEESAGQCQQQWTIEMSEEFPLDPKLCSAEANEAAEVSTVIGQNCARCHASSNPPATLAMPAIFDDACAANITEAERNNRYRNLLTRVNLQSPLDSLLIRKPTGGASVDGEEAITGYHGGNVVLTMDREISTLINWINRGAQR